MKTIDLKSIPTAILELAVEAITNDTDIVYRDTNVLKLLGCSEEDIKEGQAIIRRQQLIDYFRDFLSDRGIDWKC